MDRARLDSWLEQGILGLVGLILVLAPLLFGATGLDDFAILEGLTAFALVLWCIRFWTRSEYRILWPPIAWVVPVFVGYVIWSYTRADVEYVARVDMNRVLLYGALFFLVLDNLNRQEWTQILIYVMIFAGMAMSMYAVYQVVTQSHRVWGYPQPSSYYGRSGGTFICPNHLASYISMVLPLAVAMTLMARVNTVLKVFLGYAALVMVAGLFVTYSRAGYAATGIGLLFFIGALFYYRQFRLAAIVALILILAPMVWLGTKSAVLQKRLHASFSPAGAFGDDRFNIWPSAAAIWREHFWTGVGPGHFDVNYRPHRPQLMQLQARPYRVHNDYLNTLADYGVIGMGIIFTALAFFWVGVLRIWRFVRRSNDIGSKLSTRASIVLGASAGMIGVLLHCIVEFNMHIPALAILFVTLMALVSGHWRFATDRFWIRAGAPMRVLASMITLVAAAWFTFNAVRTIREQRPLIKADAISELDEKHLALLRKAAAAEPSNPLTAYRIGELLRRQVFQGNPGYEKIGEEAIGWFDKTMALDKHDPHAFMGKGMTLDYLGRKDEAWGYFRQSLLLDPNSYYALAHFGWHLMQLHAWQRAQVYFLKSWDLRRPDNPMAVTYQAIAQRMLQEENAPVTLSEPPGAGATTNTPSATEPPK